MNYEVEMDTKKTVFVLEGIVLGLLDQKKTLLMTFADIHTNNDIATKSSLELMIGVLSDAIKETKNQIKVLENRLAIF